MTDYAVSQLTPLGATPASNDILLMVDVDDFSTPPAGAGGSDKSVTVAELISAIPTATTSAVGLVELDGTAGDIQPPGTAAVAGATGKAADAGHVHAAIVPLSKYKASATTYSNTTLTADPDLQVSLAANTTYSLDVTLFYESAAAADPGLATLFYGPASATWTFALTYSIYHGGTPGYSVLNQSSGSFELHLGAVSTVIAATFSGVITTSSTAGSAGFEFAENTSGDSVQVLAQSRMIAQLIN